MKSIFLIALFTGFLVRLQAQSAEPHLQRFGFKVGFNYSLMNFNRGWMPSSPSIKNIWKPGFNIGFLTQIPISRYLSLQQEYTYAQMHGEDDRIKASYTLDYLSLPVLLKISPSKRIAVVVGPQFDLLIHAKEKENSSDTNITHATEERNISGVIGVEVKIVKSLFVDARYIKGFNHVGLNNRTAVNEFKWDVFSLGIGIRF